MIVGKDSWMALVACSIILLVMCGCGGICLAGYQSYFFGISNILLGLAVTSATYLFFKEKSEEDK